MKHCIALLTLVAFFSSTLPASAALFAYPSEDKAWFIVDIPAAWKPVIDDDQTLEATSPDEDAYLAFWVLKGKTEIAGLEKDIDDTLKELVKGPKLTSDKPTKKTINGIEFTMFAGTGKDSEDDSPLGFEIFLFSPQPGKLGIFYCQYDAKAPKPVIASLIKVVESIQKGK
jgi:hypothetical protein